MAQECVQSGTLRICCLQPDPDRMSLLRKMASQRVERLRRLIRSMHRFAKNDDMRWRQGRNRIYPIIARTVDCSHGGLVRQDRHRRRLTSAKQDAENHP